MHRASENRIAVCIGEIGRELPDAAQVNPPIAQHYEQ
jgi:hypothetical protein